MNYAKITDGHIQFAPKKIKDGDSTIYNPTAEVLEAHGFKQLVVDAMPEVPDGYHTEPVYADTGDAVHQSWELAEDTKETSYEAEILQILMGESA